MSVIQLQHEKLRKNFISWQCRLRKQVVRERNGRPSEGMQPILSIGDDIQTRVIVLLNPLDMRKRIQEFQFIFKKTQDPVQRQENAIKILAETYFLYPEEFSDSMTALFAADSKFARKLLIEDEVDLLFQQTNQEYRFPCRVNKLAEDEEEYQITYWHNSLFNHSLAGRPMILSMKPDWSRAENKTLY